MLHLTQLDAGISTTPRLRNVLCIPAAASDIERCAPWNAQTWRSSFKTFVRYLHLLFR